MSTHLDNILATTRATVAAAKTLVPVRELERLAAEHQPRGWAAALRIRAATGPAVIAEIKKASPSKGLIRADFDAALLARSYFSGGAAALSVLTDEPFFQGNLRNLELASAAVPLPCLRKDFIVDEYQIMEARAHHADAILLIAAALTDIELSRFFQVAHSLSLDVLVEVHTSTELDRVLSIPGTAADAVGVNNRNLKTFEVSLETSLELVERIPQGTVRVTESGIATREDLARLRAAGFDAFLIGESLMRQPDPGVALMELLAVADPKPMSIWIKICGNTSLEDALLAVEAGADAVGFVFAPSPRRVTVAQVALITPQLPSTIEKIGVFVDAALDEIVSTVRDCGLTGVQLHFDAGTELPAKLHERLGTELQILRVIHFDVENTAVHAKQIAECARNPHVNGVLVDSRTAMAVGGTGVTFNWAEARKRVFGDAGRLRLVAAGGLNPVNVAEAIATLSPWGVDVASGVEAAPGRKDPVKVQEFVARARVAKRA